MSGQIFISYRREESRWSARSLHDRLCRDFDPKHIFMDIDAIGLGEDFVRAIETTVVKCDVLIAVIGNNWLTSKDEYGDRRLDNPEDFVRMEIGTALKRDIRVIPVLVDHALMPRSADLPEDLKPLVRRNALQITDVSFEGDCQRLAAAIKQVLEKASAEEQERLATEQRQRQEAEQRPREEKERLASTTAPYFSRRQKAEQRKREDENNDRTVPLIVPAPHPETPPIVENAASTRPKPSVGVMLLALLGLILIFGLIWFASRGGRESALATPTPLSMATPPPVPMATPTPVATAALTPNLNPYRRSNDESEASKIIRSIGR